MKNYGDSNWQPNLKELLAPPVGKKTVAQITEELAAPDAIITYYGAIGSSRLTAHQRGDRVAFQRTGYVTDDDYDPTNGAGDDWQEAERKVREAQKKASKA